MMQKAFQRFASLLLSLTMLLSLASTAFAADTGADASVDLVGTDIEEVVSVNSPVSEEEIAKDLFESLSEEAQQIFLAQIATDPELTEYHRENVDPSFDPQAIPAIHAYSSELDIVRSGLANLGLSSTVTYAFTGAASAIVGGPAVSQLRLLKFTRYFLVLLLSQLLQHIGMRLKMYSLTLLAYLRMHFLICAVQFPMRCGTLGMMLLVYTTVHQ